MMIGSRGGVFFASLAGIFAARGVLAATLFSGGATDWKIAYEPCETNTPVEYAARELQATLKKVSGADFARGEGVPGAKTLYIGVDRTMPKPGDEVVVIRLKGDSVELVGNEPRAALHAVYAFLQRELGVRWLWPGEDGEFIPKLENWEVPTKPEWRHTPSIKYRGFHFCSANYQREPFKDWMARNFATAHRHGVRKEEERRHGFYSFLMTHSSSPHGRNEIFSEHPEYFCEIDGRRLPVNVCYSSEGALDTAVSRISEEIRKRKVPVDVVSIFTADNQDYCRCEKCGRMSVSDRWFGFYNKIVTKLRPQFPDVRFSTGAYQGFRAAPSFPLVETEFVEYATHGRCNRHLWDDPSCQANAHDLTLMDAWDGRGFGVGEYAYEYDVFQKYIVWAPIFSIVADVVDRAVRKKHVSLVTEVIQGPAKGPDTAVGSVINRLSELFYAQKMWDASLTVEAFLDDLTKTAFGPAAAPMKRYLEAMDRAWCRDSGCHAGIQKSGLVVCKSVLDDETRAVCDLAFKEGENVIGSATERQKLAFSREKALYRQWTDLLLLAQGDAQVLNMPRLVSADEFPKDVAHGFMLLDADGQNTEARVRAGWTEGPPDKRGRRLPQELIVEFSRVPEGAGKSFRYVANNGKRYEFALSQSGVRSQSCVSGTGVRDAHFMAEWWATQSGDTVRMKVPVSVLGGVNVGERVAMQFILQTTNGAWRYPIRESDDVKAVFSRMTRVDVPLLACVKNRRRAINRAAECGDALAAGFDIGLAEDAGECDARIDSRQRVFLFNNIELKSVSQKVRDAVRKAVRDEGGIVFFYDSARLDTAWFMGDDAFETKPEKPMGLPLALRRPSYLRPGRWLEAPFPSVGHRIQDRASPAYGYRPLVADGWTDYCRVKGAKVPEVCTLMMKPYGKGKVFVAGSRFAMSVYEMLANLWEEQCEQR